jgi:hypothetical protein
MGGMSKGINYLRLRFNEFVTVYAFCRLALGDGAANLESYSQKSTASSSHNMTHQSAKVELGEELRQTKALCNSYYKAISRCNKGIKLCSIRLCR